MRQRRRCTGPLRGSAEIGNSLPLKLRHTVPCAMSIYHAPYNRLTLRNHLGWSRRSGHLSRCIGPSVYRGLPFSFRVLDCNQNRLVRPTRIRPFSRCRRPKRDKGEFVRNLHLEQRHTRPRVLCSIQDRGTMRRSGNQRCFEQRTFRL